MPQRLLMSISQNHSHDDKCLIKAMHFLQLLKRLSFLEFIFLLTLRPGLMNPRDEGGGGAGGVAGGGAVSM